MHMGSEREKQPASARAIRPERVMALGFFAVICIGTLLLSLPIAAVGRRSIGLLDAAFTATSAVCVTGLAVVDTGTVFSVFGKTVIILLIQVGGLGFMIFATLVMVALGRRISLRNRMLIRESMNASNLQGLVRLSLWFCGIAMLIEFLGACLLSTRLIPLYGVRDGILYSLFHAVSAFCNAGFDLFGNFQSLISFQRDPMVLLTLAGLIILGGLGFSVLAECLMFRRDFRKVSLHTKLVLSVTAFLLLVGTVGILLLEWNNPKTLDAEHLSAGDKIINSFFQATTLRTAGFASIDQAGLTDTSKLLSVILMFVGASSASTGGGVKITTASVVVLMVVSVIRGRENINLFGKQISQQQVRRALTIVVISLAIVLLCSCALSLSERDSGISMMDLVFEATSAFATVGLSSANTATLNTLSQMLLMPIMFFGRVGPLTLAFALASRMESNPQNRLHYPEEKIIIG